MALERPLGASRYGPGATVNDRYEILGTLGQGGMGEAYKARDRESGQIVVIKVPYASSIGDPATFSRYERELDIGKRLDHPGIQRMLQSGRLDNGVAPYVVFEYIDGEPMREYLRKHAPLDPETAVDFAMQLADVLEYVHAHGVIHRDLKPENVLITPDAKAKLVDFGIALLKGARRLTFQRLSSEVGTPDYMAPEQVQGERGDARTDVYALGVMVFEMLTGDVPYHGDSPLAIMSQHVTTDAPLLSDRRRDVPPALEAVVYRALRRSPEDRYPSMAAFKNDLQHLDQVEIPNYTLRRPRRKMLPARAMPALLIVLALACLVLIGVLAELVHRTQVPH
ncbi:MAG: serine/threonine protein kinase [Chloroflexi bacterium]|nr:serine/threonine protein kinase [Chloroflexota bacterium]